MSKNNELENALLDTTGVGLDMYLESTGTMKIMADIAEIKQKATLSTAAGVLRERVLAALDIV